MTLEPLLDASLAIRLHVAVVLPAALLGAYQLMGPKGTRGHRLLGKIWLVLMVATAFSSFFIHSLNMFYGFGPIHLLSIYVLYASWQAYAAARRHDIAAHQRAVSGLYYGGIVGAGVFTLLPGRIMNAVVFTGHEILPLVILAVAALFLGWSAWRRRVREDAR